MANANGQFLKGEKSMDTLSIPSNYCSHFSMLSYADSVDPMYYHPNVFNNRTKPNSKSTEFHTGDRVWYQNNQYEVVVVLGDKLLIQSDHFGSCYVPSANYYQLSNVPPGLESLIKSNNNPNAYSEKNEKKSTSTAQLYNQVAISQNQSKLTTFKQGDTVQLVDLQSKKHWNGKMALIVGAKVNDKNRWPIELIDTKSRALIRPQNIKATCNKIHANHENDESNQTCFKNSINSENNEYITTKTMNLCRLNQMDFKSLIDDINIDEVVTSLYVRVKWINSEYIVCKITKTMCYPKCYTFMGIITTKQGLTVSYGTFKGIITTNIKLNKISNDDFTNNEINLWKQKIQKYNIQLPTQNSLINAAETIDIIRKTVKLQSQNLASKQQKSQQPGAHKDITCNHNLRNNYLNSCFTAINLGCNCFWYIPTAAGDSQYVAFLLAKNCKNEKNLIAAQQIAKNQRNDIVFAEIREWIVSEEVKKGYWKCKGWLIDCKHESYAWNIYEVLSNFIPHTFGGDTPANFCRIVLKEFGYAYMRVQLLPIQQKPTLNKQGKNKPFGGKYNYKNGEGSVATGEYSDEGLYEYDFSSMDDDTEIVSVETMFKYDDIGHMMVPKLSQNERVVYKGEQYDVICRVDDKIRIENNFSSYLVSVNEVNKIS